MATKSGILSAINTALSVVITKAKIITGLTQIINELWQTPTTISDTTGTNKFYYNLTFGKQGNYTNIDGFITNKYATAKGATIIGTIPNSVYYAKTGKDTVIVCATSAGTLVKVSLSESNIYLIDSIAPNQTIYFNARFLNND